MKKFLIVCFCFIYCAAEGQDNWDQQSSAATGYKGTVHQSFGKVSFDLYCKVGSWGFGQQFYPANFHNGTFYDLHVTGEYVAKLTCGGESVSKLDFTCKKYQSVIHVDENDPAFPYILPKGYGSDFSGLVPSAAREDCEGQPITATVSRDGSKIRTRDRITGLQIRNLKLFAIQDDGSEVPVSFDGVLSAAPVGAQPGDTTSNSPAAASSGQQRPAGQVVVGAGVSVGGSGAVVRSADEVRREEEEPQRKEEERRKEEARQARIAASQEVSSENQQAAAAAGAAILTAAGFMKDHWTDNAAFLRYYLGVGFEVLPLLANVNDGTLETTTASYPYGTFGLELGLFNNKGISLHLSPYVNYGLEILSGASGGHLTWGGNAELRIGRKNTSLFKVFLQGGYFNRSGSYSVDDDAVAASIGVTTASDRMEQADYNYSILRFGGGFMFHFVDQEGATETWIKPGIFWERASFFPSTVKPVMVGEIQLMVSSLCIFDVSYSHNYLIGGTADGSKFSTNNNQSFVNFSIIKTGIF